jgi:hypothetical protein
MEERKVIQFTTISTSVVGAVGTFKTHMKTSIVVKLKAIKLII